MTNDLGGAREAEARPVEEPQTDTQAVLDAVNRWCIEAPDARPRAAEIAEVTVLVGEVRHLRTRLTAVTQDRDALRAALSDLVTAGAPDRED